MALSDLFQNRPPVSVDVFKAITLLPTLYVLILTALENEPQTMSINMLKHVV